MPNCDLNKVAKLFSLKSYFVMGVLLQICCLFSEHIFYERLWWATSEKAMF